MPNVLRASRRKWGIIVDEDDFHKLRKQAAARGETLNQAAVNAVRAYTSSVELTEEEMEEVTSSIARRMAARKK